MHFYPYSYLHSNPTTPCVAGRDCVLSSGAAAYWRLGEAQGNSLRDEMGATWGNYANATGFGYTGALPADPDTAVNFSGVDDYAVVADAGPGSPLRLQDSFSLELWVRLGETQQSEVYFLDKGNRYAVIYGYLPNTVEFYADPGTFTGESPRSSSALTLNDTNWHHIVYSYDHTSNTFRAFLDGSLVREATVYLRVGSSDDPLYLAASDPPYSPTLNNADVALDEVAIYRRALSVAEVEGHFAARHCAPCTANNGRCRVLLPMADTFVTSLLPDANRGNTSTLAVEVIPNTAKGSTTPFLSRTLLRFSLDPLLGVAPRSITRAQLFLYSTRAVTPEAVVLYRNQSDFAEMEATWQTQPSAADVPHRWSG